MLCLKLYNINENSVLLSALERKHQQQGVKCFEWSKRERLYKNTCSL